MKLNLIYTLTYSGSIEDHKDIGCLSRLEAEFRYFSDRFNLTIFSNDSNQFLEQYSSRINGRFSNPIRFQGISKKIYLLLKQSRFKIVRKLGSFIKLIEFWFLLPLFSVKFLKDADCILIKHPSSAIGLVLLKKIHNLKVKVVLRNNWGWSDFANRQDNIIKGKIISFLEKIVLKSCDLILVADQTLNIQVGNFLGEKENIKIIPNWVDTKLFIPKPENKKDFDIINIGRLTYQKNHVLLLNAVCKLQEKLKKEIRVLIIGKGELKEELERFSIDNKLNLKIIEKVNNEELPNYLIRSYLFAMTSRFEGNPKALLEAMSCSVPVLATNISGINNIINDGVTGLLCKEDVDSASQALMKLFSDVPLYNAIKEHSRDYILSYFSFDKIMDEICNFIINHKNVLKHQIENTES